MSRVDSFLELAVKQGGSDLHLVSGQPPRIRINGLLHSIRFRELSVDDLRVILDEFMPEPYRRVLEERRSVDFAYVVEGIGRFRANVYYHLNGVAASLRVIPSQVPGIDETGLPSVVKQAVSQGKGLTLVTGPTGSGKSTSLAAMVEHINCTRRAHVITLEDPIEFIHTPVKSSLTQREIGLHAPSFAEGLRSALREDPDVILVGELRDQETISLALTAAETGVQILGTLHTNGGARSVDRIINVFPSRRQDQVRAMLADSLRMVVSQQLVRTADGSARRLAAEVLVNTPAAAAIIRAGHSHKLASVIQSGARSGMQSLDAVLKTMVQQGTITAAEAYRRAIDRTQFERMVVQEEAA